MSLVVVDMAVEGMFVEGMDVEAMAGVGMVDTDVANKVVEDMVFVETTDIGHQHCNLEKDIVHNCDGVDDDDGDYADIGCNSDTDSCYSFDTDNCCNGQILFHIRNSLYYYLNFI